MSEELADVRGVKIAYETFGDVNSPPLLLVFGMNGQMIWWDDRFCRLLVDLGFFVIRFDNRDSGHSQDIKVAPRVWRSALKLVRPPYTLDDLADDSVGVLDELGIASAHIAGLSMGSMVAQTVAIKHPSRVRSLTSIMGTTGRPTVGLPTKLSMFGAVFGKFPDERSANIERTMVMLRALASTNVPFEEERLRAMVTRSADRGINTLGSRRQLAATLAQPDRTKALRKLAVPALVIHGTSDPLIGISGGRATAEAIPDATFMPIDGMGHDMPTPTWEPIASAIAATAHRGEQQRHSTTR